MFEGNLNIYIFKQFSLSKILDQIREYSDTTKRIFKATGIISFDNGFVELAYRELCACIFEEEIIKNTDNVVIMPVNTDELSSLIDKSSEYDEIISKVHKLFEVDKINFDIEWREKFMGAII